MNCSILNLTLSQQGHVYAPEDLGRQDILVSGNKTVVIALSVSPEDFPGCGCINLDGTIVCPGFIDQHVHLTSGGGEAGPHTRTSEVRLSRLAEAGVMSVVGLLGIDSITRHSRPPLAKTRALEFGGISAQMLIRAYSLPSSTITDSIDRDMVLVDKVIGVKCAISNHRSSAPGTSALANIVTQLRVGGLLGCRPGISVFHMGDSPHMLEPLYQTLERRDMPTTKLSPTCINRAEPLFQAALEYARKDGYIDITNSVDGPVDPATIIATALRQNVPLSRVTLNPDGNGNQPEFDELDNLTGIGVTGFGLLAEAMRQLMKVHAIPLEQAPCPLTRMVAEFLALGHKERLTTGRDADILVLDDALEVHHLWVKGKTVVEEQKACTKGMFE